MSSELKSFQPKIEKQVTLLSTGAGVTLVETVFLKKIGGSLTGYHSKVTPRNPKDLWLQVDPDSFGLDPVTPDDVQVTVTITVPADAANGVHLFDLQFIPEKKADGGAEAKGTGAGQVVDTAQAISADKETDTDQGATVKVEIDVQSESTPPFWTRELIHRLGIIIAFILLILAFQLLARQCSSAGKPTAMGSPLVHWPAPSVQPAYKTIYGWEAML